MKLETHSTTLDFRVISITSMEQHNIIDINPTVKLTKLLKLGGKSWTSERFCSYPQKIIIEFPYPVNLYQLNILSHNKKISRRLRFYYYFPTDTENMIFDYTQIPFSFIGYVNLRDNKANNYNIREYKKIFIKIRCQYLKIELEKNYINGYNKYDQVGLIHIECIGRNLEEYIFLASNNDKNNLINRNVEKILKGLCPVIFDKLIKFVNDKKNQGYANYDEIKNKLNDLIRFAKKIYQIELFEKESMNENDNGKVMEFQTKKEKAKNELKDFAAEINKLFQSELDNDTDNDNNDNSGYDIEGNIDEDDNNGIDTIINKFNNNIDNNNEFSEEDSKEKNEKINLKNSSHFPEISIIEDNKDYIDEKENSVEKLDPKFLKSFSLLMPHIKENGLKNLLSQNIGYKLEGFKILNANLDKIFSDENLKDIIYQLINLIGMFLEDKNTLGLKQTSDLIENLFNRISEEDDIKNDKKLQSHINKNIMNVLKENFGKEGDQTLFNKMDKPTELFLSILDKNIFNFDSLIASLLKEDINNNTLTTKNAQKIIPKLNILKKILSDFDNKINNGITTKESFPKEVLAEYLILNIKNKDNKVKKLVEEILKLYINLFGTDIIQQIASSYLNDDDDLKNFCNQFPSLKSVLNKLFFPNETSSQINLFIPSQKEKYLKQTSFEINYTNLSNENFFSEDKNENDDKSKKTNICEICRANLGTKSNDEHIPECKMYTLCKECKENILVEKLNEHRLIFCKNKNKFKQCSKCKEAIILEEYDSHVNKNACNDIKFNMSRCPFCHHDIEKDREGFYQHLVVDGCAYQINY